MILKVLFLHLIAQEAIDFSESGKELAIENQSDPDKCGLLN